MSPSKDPERWADAGDAPESLQKLLRSAREDVPSQRSLAALGVVVPAFIAEGAGTAAATAKAATAAKLGATAKAAEAVKAGGVALSTKLATLVVVGAIAGGSYYFSRSNHAAPPQSTVTASPQPQTPNVEAPRVDVNPPTSMPTEPAVSVPTVSESAVSESAGVEASGAPIAGPVEHKPGVAKASTDELPLLQRARSALKSEPNTALALVRRHAQDFPRSQFTQEREVIRIEALRALGRNEEAERAGEDFSRRFPGSAHESKLNRENP